MSSTNPNRQPQGIPAGGQFAAKTSAESEVELALPTVETKANAFDAIHAVLNGTEWHAETIERVAEIVTAAGSPIAEPGDDDKEGPVYSGGEACMETHDSYERAAAAVQPESPATRPDPIPIRLDIPEDRWEAHGDEADERSFLHCVVQVCGTDFVADAYGVHEDENGLQTADWEEFGDEQLDNIYNVARAEGQLETVTIGGREYVLVITPLG
jgi:hypothetical protein